MTYNIYIYYYYCLIYATHFKSFYWELGNKPLLGFPSLTFNLVKYIRIRSRSARFSIYVTCENQCQLVQSGRKKFFYSSVNILISRLFIPEYFPL